MTEDTNLTLSATSEISRIEFAIAGEVHTYFLAQSRGPKFRALSFESISFEIHRSRLRLLGILEVDGAKNLPNNGAWLEIFP